MNAGNEWNRRKAFSPAELMHVRLSGRSAPSPDILPDQRISLTAVQSVPDDTWQNTPKSIQS